MARALLPMPSYISGSTLSIPPTPLHRFRFILTRLCVRGCALAFYTTYQPPDNSPTSRSNTAKISASCPFHFPSQLEADRWASMRPCTPEWWPRSVSSTATVVYPWASACAPTWPCTSAIPSRSSLAMPSTLCKIQSDASISWLRRVDACTRETWYPSVASHQQNISSGNTDVK